MYVVTFYSYKGGVGRSQALMNVAGQLALQGRRVLIVDFDLEAPGLHSYRPFINSKINKGLVEFVNEYLDTLTSPDVRDYIVESDPIGGSNNKTIWLMPAGCQDPSYGSRLNRIEWNELYTRNHGYLLFEDLKQQWKDSLQPDYVLIDSRTGHTDVGGICTRQLPNAVVAMMLPNHQNIAGMKQVVQDIRAVELESIRSKVVLHFVFSNVPELDDEADVLGRLTRIAGKELNFSNETARIHHYASLDLLDQAIYTLDRPKTRLAAEYRSLVKQIVRENLEDRDGALGWLTEMPTGTRFQLTEFNEQIAKILQFHSADGAILAAVAGCRMELGDMEVAADLFKAALECGNHHPEMLNRYAGVLLYLKRYDEATTRLQEILKATDSGSKQIVRAVKLLTTLSRSKGSNRESLFLGLSNYPAISNLSPKDRIEVAEILLSTEQVEAAKELVQDVVSERWKDFSDTDPMDQAMIAIGTGAWSRAIEILESSGGIHGSIQVVFNLGMALWAQQAAPDLSFFNRTVELDREGQEETRTRKSANYQQCIGISLAITKDVAQAKERLAFSLKLAKQAREDVFSAWRYHQVSVAEFESDITEILSFCDGEMVRPKFFGVPLLAPTKPH